MFGYKLFAVAALTSTSVALAAPGVRDSVYTSIAKKDCTVIETDPESGYAREKCPGLLDRNGRGYTVYVESLDAREDITLATPDASSIPLGIVMAGGGGFNTLPSNVIEWRGARGPNGRVVPDSIIVRSTTQIDGDGLRARQTLFVFKVNAFRACLVDSVDATADANANARARAISDTKVPNFNCSPTGDR